MENTKNEKDFGTGIPENAIEALARVLLPEIEKFYNTEEGRGAFEKWKSEKKKNCIINKLSVGGDESSSPFSYSIRLYKRKNPNASPILKR